VRLEARLVDITTLAVDAIVACFGADALRAYRSEGVA
jgi:hypothetical protein